jgi:hypothetical protein
VAPRSTWHKSGTSASTAHLCQPPYVLTARRLSHLATVSCPYYCSVMTFGKIQTRAPTMI